MVARVPVCDDTWIIGEDTNPVLRTVERTAKSPRDLNNGGRSIPENIVLGSDIGTPVDIETLLRAATGRKAELPLVPNGDGDPLCCE